MSDYICPYNCSYRTNSGFCGYTSGYDACQYRLIAQKPKLKRRIVYRGAVYNALEAERINHLDDILTDRYKEGFHDGLKRALEILANDVKDVEGE